MGNVQKTWKVIIINKFYNKTKTIMESRKEELFSKMKELWSYFETEHGKTTKVSQKNARSLINDLKKLIGDYRKASVEESKGK